MKCALKDSARKGKVHMKVKYTKGSASLFTIGKTYEISEDGRLVDNNGFSFGPRHTPEAMLQWMRNNGLNFEPINGTTYELHITCNDGKTTNAVYKENGKIEKRTEAVCAPSDTFDFATGAQTAFDRVFPKAQPSQPIAPQEDKAKFKVGDKAKVINARNSLLKVGDIVELYQVDYSTGDFRCKRVSDGQPTYANWLFPSDVEPYAEPEQPKEPIKLYCVKDYNSGIWLTKGKTYEVADNNYVCMDDGYRTPYDNLGLNGTPFKSYFVPLVKRPAKVGEWVYATDESKLLMVKGECFGNCVVLSDGRHTKINGKEISYLVLDGYVPEPEKEPEPVYYSGKVVCAVTDGDGTFTVGKVYEFVDGQVLDNKSCKRPTGMKMKSLNDGYLANWYYRFIPYLGEA